MTEEIVAEDICAKRLCGGCRVRKQNAEENAEESAVHKRTEQLKESTALFFLCIFLLIETCSVILYISVVHHY